MRRFGMMLAGWLVTLVIARPVVWCLSYRSIDKMLAWQRYNSSSRARIEGKLRA